MTVVLWLRHMGNIRRIATGTEPRQDRHLVVRAEQVIWPDGALGCGQPGGIYTQATVPGYLVEFQFAGRHYRYHGSLAGPFVYCERPGPYLKRLGPSQ